MANLTIIFGTTGLDRVLLSVGKKHNIVIDGWNAGDYKEEILAEAIKQRPNFKEEEIRSTVCKLLDF